MTSAAARAQAAFATSFGRPAEGLWAAPGRVNLIGEHTDYNGGLALPVALPWRTYAAVRPRGDDLVRARSESMPGGPVTVALADVAAGHPGDWTAYVVGVFWALREAGYQVPGADVFLTSDLPVGVGLSSSAALECAVGAALSDLACLDLLANDRGRAALADVCRRAENHVAGVPTGGLDQAASLQCREGHALLLDCRNGRTEQVRFDLDAAGLALLVVDTRVAHAVADGQYADRRRVCERAADALGVATLREVEPASLRAALAALPDERAKARVRHVVTEIDRVVQCVDALHAQDFAEMGRLMLASHKSLRDDYEVSCPQLDDAVESACAAGALGARMTGAGFGGSAIALVRAQDADAIGGAVGSAFGRSGFGLPDIRTARASGGAVRLR